MNPTPAAATAPDQGVGRALSTVLLLLIVFGPISMDLYLPVLPGLTTDLHSATSTAQLTVTACLLGLAFGQLVAGPASDRYGRRRPLLIGVVAYILASVLCALAPNIAALIVARFIQGLAGAAGLVIAYAAGRDLYRGSKLVRYYGRLTVFSGLAAVIGPVLGGQLASLTDWRGIFLLLAAIGAVILAASFAVLRESLPPHERTSGGLARSGRDFHRLLRDRVLLGTVLIGGFTYAALFAYLSGATYILQGTYRLSPQGYSLAFGLNSLGFMAFGFAAGRLSEHWSEHGTLLIGLVMCLLGAGSLVITATAHLPLAAMVLSLFTMVGGVAVTTPPTTSLALANYPDIAGTASSLLGMARFAFGALTAPLVGFGGPDDALPLGLVAALSAALALAVYPSLMRRQTNRRARRGVALQTCATPTAVESAIRQTAKIIP